MWFGYRHRSDYRTAVWGQKLTNAPEQVFICIWLFLLPWLKWWVSIIAMKPGVSVALSFLHLPGEAVFRSTPHSAGVLLRTRLWKPFALRPFHFLYFLLLTLHPLPSTWRIISVSVWVSQSDSLGGYHPVLRRSTTWVSVKVTKQVRNGIIHRLQLSTEP